MSEMIHRATIVTSFDDGAASAAFTLARVLFEATMITPILVSPVNSYRSFAILTCGSKSGWAEKTEDDAAREAFTAWVEHQSYEDGSNALECVTVEYGRDLHGLELKQDEPGKVPVDVAPAPAVDWEQRRWDAALAALNWAGVNSYSYSGVDALALECVKVADAIIAALKGETK